MQLVLLAVLVGAALIMPTKNLLIFVLAALLTIAFRISSSYDEDRMWMLAVLILTDSCIFIYGIIQGIKKITRRE